MLRMCRRDQWDVEDLDWTVAPRPMPREHEVAIVQYFRDMAGIELLAGELFAVQRDNTDDPTLRAIFDTFVTDEIRHSKAAARLAQHYDVHHHRDYRMNPHLVRFRTHFVEALQHLTPDIANAYITTGELLLDVALLRSLDEFVDDEMSHQAMKLINRDESRHIAVDFHMVEYYSSEDYVRWLEAQPPRSRAQRVRGALALTQFLYQAQPFFKAVFFEPMDLTDPTGRRMLDAFKRIQILGEKEEVGSRPFSRFMRAMTDLFRHPVAGRFVAPVVERVMGVDGRLIEQLYTEEEARRARQMTFDELAQDALSAKLTN